MIEVKMEEKLYYCPDCGLSLCYYNGIYCSSPIYKCSKCKTNWQFDKINLEECGE